MVSIHVAQLLQSPQGATRHEAFEVPAADFGDLPLAAPVRGEVTLTNLARSVLADVTFASALHAECGRCLEPAVQPIAGRLQEEFVPTVDVRTGAALASGSEDEAFPIDAEHVLHLDEALRQHLVMALRLQPLCRPACRGLCPTCGHDLNQGPCACAPDLANSPFQALGALLSNEHDGART